LTRSHALLVIGIHREERAFGAAVASGLDGVDLLAIPEGLSGRRPRPDQRFHYDTLHRALYLQLLPHVQEHHSLLIDLHTGLDPQAPAADLYSRDPESLARRLALAAALSPAPRLYSLCHDRRLPSAETVIPWKIWGNPRFLYVGLEIYLAEPGAGRPVERAYARQLIEALIQP
jgi:hypothetical protein